MKNKPLISIVVPTYNRLKTLPNTIQSILKQTYDHWELIIVDDGSTDGTEKLVHEYSARDSRIKYVFNGRNKGPSAARNTGIRHSQGEYIAFLDSDDEWLENHLIDSLTALQEEDLKVVFSLWLEKNSAGQVYEIHDNDLQSDKMDILSEQLNPPVHKNRIIFPSPDFLEFTSSKCNFYCTHINTMVCHKGVIDKTGLFNEKLFASEDMEFITRVMHYYTFCLIKDHHFIYFQGDDNIHSFIDRRKTSFEDILMNPKIVNKLTYCGVYRNKTYKLLKELIKNSDRIKDKDLCIKRCNKRIGVKYFTLGYLNKKVNKFKAIYFIIKSLPYQPHYWKEEKFKTLVNTLFPFIYKDFSMNESDLRVYS
jgi:glycosyltransferase involved in cell wall biosynthesis